MKNSTFETCSYEDGCAAYAAEGYAQCLRHLPDEDRARYLSRFKPGDDFDAPGVVFGWSLLKQVESVFTGPGEKGPHFGTANFNEAVFTCDVTWGHAVFDGLALFIETQFRRDAWFWNADFHNDALFQNSRFRGEAAFGDAKVAGQLRLDQVHVRGPAKLHKITCVRLDLGDADFDAGFDLDGAVASTGIALDGTRFHADASFNGCRAEGNVNARKASFEKAANWFGAEFAADTDFTACVFTGPVHFNDTRFTGRAIFRSAKFHDFAFFEGVEFGAGLDLTFATFDRALRADNAAFSGPLEGPVRAEALVATGARFNAPLRFEVLARHLRLNEAHFAAAAVISVRYAAVELTYTSTAAPLTLISQPSPFLGHHEPEHGRPADARGSLTSMTGCDGANVILHDIDLSRCAFTGAYHLDQVRLEGRCTFASVPRGWRFGRALPPAVRWTSRKVLAEEHCWRAADQPGRARIKRAGWNPEPLAGPAPEAGPAGLAVLYRQLRTSFEGCGNAPGADDFYYGEMEARRHDPETPWGERVLLHAYWLVSGYALRATRALGFLVAAMAATLLALMLLGLPDTSTAEQITGTAPSAGHPVSLTMSSPAAELTGPLADRLTTERAEQAAQIVVNSVIFRSAGQSLTTPGTWIEMASRLCEPVLLGFAAFAARGRVKR